MGRHIKTIVLTDAEKQQLEAIIRKASSPQSIVFRAKIIVNTAEGESVEQICDELKTTRATVSKWKQRFLAKGLAGLEDHKRSGHPTKYGTKTRMRILATACKPPVNRKRWTIRTLARYLELNRGIVQRVLKEESLRLV